MNKVLIRIKLSQCIFIWWNYKKNTAHTWRAYSFYTRNMCNMKIFTTVFIRKRITRKHYDSNHRSFFTLSRSKQRRLPQLRTMTIRKKTGIHLSDNDTIWYGKTMLQRDGLAKIDLNKWKRCSFTWIIEAAAFLRLNWKLPWKRGKSMCNLNKPNIWSSKIWYDGFRLVRHYQPGGALSIRCDMPASFNHDAYYLAAAMAWINYR